MSFDVRLREPVPLCHHLIHAYLTASFLSCQVHLWYDLKTAGLRSWFVLSVGNTVQLSWALGSRSGIQTSWRLFLLHFKLTIVILSLCDT